jgi:uncharacterized protein YjbI with pentapeptide repeats
VTQNDEPPVERKKSRWWPTRGEAVRILAALLAVGVLLFVVRSYYVGFLLGRPLTVLGAAAVVAAVVVLIRVGQHYEWTGFGKLVQPKPDDNRDIQPRKTLWDWLQLLIVPVALAGIGFWFTVQQDARQQEIETQRARQAQKIENQRAEAERELAVQRAQDEALQACLDQMSNLLLERNLRESQQDSEARTLAQARTFAALGRLDRSRKSQVMQFLTEAKLVQVVDGKVPVINLNEAGLDNVDMSGADLRGAHFVVADLDGASLVLADFSWAILSGAKLRKASLLQTNLSEAILNQANLRGAYLNEANLSDASLRDADLREANLYATELSGADLSGADLSKAFLGSATGVTNEELKKQAASLEGATLPNRQTYEEWLKSRGEDGG